MTTYKEKVPIGSDIAGSKGDETAQGGSDLMTTACKALLDAIKAFPHDKSPLVVILSFDEIHALEEHYIDFHRALRTLLSQPVFSLFLSTAGHLHKFIPNPSVDPSEWSLKDG